MKTTRLLLTLLAALSVAVQPLDAGPRTGGGGSSSKPSSSSSSSSRPAAPSSSSRSWGSGGSTASKPAAPASSSSWGSSTSASKPSSGSTNSTDDALAAKSRTTGNYGQTKATSYPVVKDSSGASYSDTGSGSFTRGRNQYFRDGSGQFVPQIVVIHNHPQSLGWYNGGYGYWDGPNWSPYNNTMVAYSSPSDGHALAVLGWIFLSVLIVAAAAGLIYWFMNRETESGYVARGGGYRSRDDGPSTPSSYASAPPRPSQAPLRSDVPDAPAPGFDKHQGGEWTKVRPGSLITLSDPLTGVTGKEYTVSAVQTLTQAQDLGRWLFFVFEDDAAVRLMVKIVDDKIALSRLERSDVDGMTRQELIDHDLAVFFQKPTDENAFNVDDLKYTKDFNDWDNNDKSHCTNYVQKAQGEMWGHLSTVPQPTGVSNRVETGIIEYAASGGQNPDPLRNNLILLETGSLVESFLAGPVKFSEVTVENPA